MVDYVLNEINLLISRRMGMAFNEQVMSNSYIKIWNKAGNDSDSADSNLHTDDELEQNKI